MVRKVSCLFCSSRYSEDDKQETSLQFSLELVLSLSLYVQVSFLLLLLLDYSIPRILAVNVNWDDKDHIGWWCFLSYSLLIVLPQQQLITEFSACGALSKPLSFFRSSLTLLSATCSKWWESDNSSDNKGTSWRRWVVRALCYKILHRRRRDSLFVCKKLKENFGTRGTSRKKEML